MYVILIVELSPPWSRALVGLGGDSGSGNQAALAGPGWDDNLTGVELNIK